jgi:hypothetical protein
MSPDLSNRKKYENTYTSTDFLSKRKKLLQRIFFVAYVFGGPSEKNVSPR